MKYLGAYLLATLGGNASPSAQDILKIIESVGQDVDMEEANKVVDALKGKTVADLISEGKKKLSSVPSGGSAPAAAAPAGGAAPAAGKSPAKKEEVKEESEDDDMGFGLFD
ncbi:hypothetical protein PFISCL1PPCAC_19476 [Pristionchus fissidentatus]|uniref:Large ribosomal subunit protein P2 n=1 Tax=Pristionchus fissidentatus TaxID=1538716 RepID=A0AAV5WEG0_9BILA|nr:hypothetical protein PFISCL1PPCAC_19476 [Pristionchus fissidentatus]